MLGVCKQCGKPVSDKAIRCPHCGREAPFAQSSEVQSGRAEVEPRNAEAERSASASVGPSMSEVADGSGLFYIIAFLLVMAGVVGFSVMQSGRGTTTTTTTTEFVVNEVASGSSRNESPVSELDTGNAVEQVEQGLAYYYGRGVAQNYSEAARLFRRAADQGDSDGQNNLGAMYELGLGVPQDNAEAVRLYRLAASQGNPNARANLGRFEPMPIAAVSAAQPQSALNEGDCIDISVRQGMGAGERCRDQVAGRPQAGLNEGDCIDISVREGMGAGERCRAQVAGRPQAGLNEGDCIDISVRQGMGAGERCRAEVRAAAARH